MLMLMLLSNKDVLESTEKSLPPTDWPTPEVRAISAAKTDVVADADADADADAAAELSNLISNMQYNNHYFYFYSR